MQYLKLNACNSNQSLFQTCRERNCLHKTIFLHSGAIWLFSTAPFTGEIPSDPPLLCEYIQTIKQMCLGIQLFTKHLHILKLRHTNCTIPIIIIIKLKIILSRYMDPFCCSEEDINPTNAAMAIVCLILNIFLPGFGTILNACLGVRVLPGLIYGFL